MLAHVAVAAAVIPVLRLAPLAAQQPSVLADSLVEVAVRSVELDRPWQATRMLAPLVRDPDARSPRVLLAAARAAVRWQGFAQVVALLDGQPWLDSLEHGAGRALLARALVEKSQPAVALAHARGARDRGPAADRGERLVTLARAFEGAGARDSAARWYLEAASDVSDAAEWLVLRAAALEPDSAARAELYTRIDHALTKSRIPWTEARALEHAGRPVAAAARYEALGAPLAAVRLRLAVGDSALRAGARAQLGRLLAASPPAVDAAQAIALFDREFPTRTPVEELHIARRAARAGMLERAATGYARAGPGRLTDRDRFDHGNVLMRLGRHQDAIASFESVQSPALRADAQYQRARTILRSGRVDAALAALARVVERFPRDSEPAATALYLTADLLADRQREDSARATFALAFERYPRARFGRRAGFQAALLSFLREEYGKAAEQFARLGATPGAEEAVAGLYWAGRALERAGDATGARRRWQDVVSAAPTSYYAVLARRRLGIEPPPAPAAADQDTTPPRAPDAVQRADLLRRIGLAPEAELELGSLTFAGGGDPSKLLSNAAALQAAGLHGRALRLASRARDRGARWDRQLARLLYPFPYRELITAESRPAGIDPLLVAGLIRQESAFDVEARSIADARGLMQLLPSVGQAYAREIGLAHFEPVLLYQPDVNINLGIDHLAEAIQRFGAVEHALAAYNAGVDRVQRWLGQRGASEDPEIFVERIPFVETRDYVRKVLTNHEVYRALYEPPLP